AELLADPVEKIAGVGGARHPSIPLPIDLFGDRKNSSGIDLNDRGVLADIAGKVARPQPFVSSEVETLRDPLAARPSTLLGTNGD
ncbi:hypothetical protein, partial [Streptomyces scabiei]|uniref:hypothetical protein n=1 Tax=Streptomyces scabiei TaxID=1930 RepID=UPI0038F746E5